MDRGGRERGQADSDVFGAAWLRSAVAYPLARLGHNPLAGVDVEDAALVLHPQQASQHDCDFFELRTLTRFLPAAWRDHTGHADARVARVHETGEFLDPFRLVAR